MAMNKPDLERIHPQPKARRRWVEWSIYSLYLPPALLALLVLYYFIKGLFGL
jgi:hypothetical protein